MLGRVVGVCLSWLVVCSFVSTFERVLELGGRELALPETVSPEEICSYSSVEDRLKTQGSNLHLFRPDFPTSFFFDIMGFETVVLYSRNMGTVTVSEAVYLISFLVRRPLILQER